MSEPLSSEAPGIRVHLVDSTDSESIANSIITNLEHLGVDASAPPPTAPGQVRAVIVLISPGALDDPIWQRRVEQLRSERLVPVKLGALDDTRVPEHLRSLNWIIYRPDDAAFIATLFTGINIDASRFRDAQDTRALAERWEGSGRSADLLLDDVGEIRRRAENFAGDSGEHSDFLESSLKHAHSQRRQRANRIAFRTVLLGLSVALIAFTVFAVGQAVIRSRNAVSFALGNSENSSRPDLAAIKAGASLVDADVYNGSDGRLRIATDALSKHWPSGFVTAGDWAVAAVDFGSDGALVGVDNSGSRWRWESLGKPGIRTATAAPPTAGADVALDGELFISGDGDTVTVIAGTEALHTFSGLGRLSALRLAPSTDRALLVVDHELRVIEDLSSATAAVRTLSRWDAVLDLVRTSEGRAVALAQRADRLYLVRDDGAERAIGTAPGPIEAGSISPDGTSVALIVEGTIWTSGDGGFSPSGVVLPGIATAMRMTADGLVLIADRTRGTWVADPVLGLDLGGICSGFIGTTDFVVDPGGDRVLCPQSSIIGVDSTAGLAPRSRTVDVPKPQQSADSSGRVSSLSLVDGMIIIERRGEQPFALDPSGASFAHDFEQPPEVAAAEFFGSGALLGATGVPTTVALTPDGNTLAIGFEDGGLVEIDVNELGHLARVGSWQLPDHGAITSISWSPDRSSIYATTGSGLEWRRDSCSGCWGADTLSRHIAGRVWACYPNGDIDAIGATARRAFDLRVCETGRRPAA